jgi:drug/metabolite transporter (DMT)-like permease
MGRAAISSLRGIAAMVASTGLFVANDTLMKLAMADLPPLLVLVMRGVAALVWCIPLLLVLGYARQFHRAFNPWVLLRALSEAVAVICYVLALAKNPLANIIAIVQITPLLLIVGVSLLWGERVGAVRWVLIALGFAGALLAAQPDSGSASMFLALGLGTAFFGAGRDLTARRIPKDIPVLVATLTTLFVVMAAALLASLAFETWPQTQPRHYAMMAGAGFFLVFAHVCLFLAYRLGEAATIAPFFYAFTPWAVLFGYAVFGDLPNAVGATGILLIALSGLAVVFHGQRLRRAAVA